MPLQSNEVEPVRKTRSKSGYECLKVTPKDKFSENVRTRSMISRRSKGGIGYSVFNFSNVRHIVAMARPRTGETLREQARDALQTIEAVMREKSTQGAIVKQTVFMSGREELDECRQVIRDFYGVDMPATTFVAQPLCSGKLLAIEALGICQSTGDVEIERHSESLVVTRYQGMTWAYCGHITPNTSDPSVYARSYSAFVRMQKTLGSQGFGYEQVFRTWLYLGDIVGPEADTQRYKELNRARAEFYKDMRFIADKVPTDIKHLVYPASTGIGTSCTHVHEVCATQGCLEGPCSKSGNQHFKQCPACADIVMSCIAVGSEGKDLVLVPLENPGQTAAFDYGKTYSPRSPKFSRAMAVITKGVAMTFISGTASITDSESRFIGDIEGQTCQTLDNMQALVTAENFERHGIPGYGGTLKDMALVRVYIKRQEDYAKARAIVEARLGELPTVYAVADVCRPELLVEMEGIVVTEKRTPQSRTL
jgi:enamine deaminase RidA (YjgF/YER057c/UK114 family)